MEIWKDVREYEGFYQVSNFGRVRSLRGKKITIMKQQLENGYCFVAFKFKKNGKWGQGDKKAVNRLVFEAFYRRLLPNEEAHHLNKIRSDNRPQNLVAKDKSLHVREHHLGTHHSQQTRKLFSMMRKGKKRKKTINIKK